MEYDDLNDFLGLTKLIPVRKGSAPPVPTTNDPLEAFVPASPIIPDVLPSVAAPLDPQDLDSTNIQSVVRSYFERMPPPTADDASAHLYRLNLAVEPETRLLGIYEASGLRSTWGVRAQRVQEALAGAWGLSPEEVPERVDLTMRALGWAEAQRANASGKVLESALEHLLRAVSGVPEDRLVSQLVVESRSEGEARPDITIFDDSGKVRSFLLAKWSAHHDRCKQVKVEALSCLDQHPDARIAVVTNEFCPTRLYSLLTARTNGRQVCDVVYHVAPQLLPVAHDVPSILGDFVAAGRLKSVGDLLRDFWTWASP